MEKDLQEISDQFKGLVYENGTEYLKSGVLLADSVISQQLLKATVLHIWKMLPNEKICPKN